MNFSLGGRLSSGPLSEYATVALCSHYGPGFTVRTILGVYRIPGILLPVVKRPLEQHGCTWRGGGTSRADPCQCPLGLLGNALGDLVSTVVDAVALFDDPLLVGTTDAIAETPVDTALGGKSGGQGFHSLVDASDLVAHHLGHDAPPSVSGLHLHIGHAGHLESTLPASGSGIRRRCAHPQAR